MYKKHIIKGNGLISLIKFKPSTSCRVDHQNKGASGKLDFNQTVDWCVYNHNTC